MVRALLIAAVLALLGCEGERAPAEVTASHSGLACAACHRGAKADSGRASVPREACTASGCHQDAGPPQVTLATARFEHRNHGVNGDVALSCAGCHTHDAGNAPLRASVDACALCHTQDLQSTKPEDCRLCHSQPDHAGPTSQGIPIAHASLPWLETGCGRCHYDVLAAERDVALETCTKCHARAPAITRRGIARDLHPGHRGVTCTSCHEAGLHRIGAMSSAVNLQCADCHDRAHSVPVADSARAGTCARCHEGVHRAQQRLVLGFVGNEPVLPSAKFVLGLTCRSCHVAPGPVTISDAPRRGQGGACAACHEREYARVLSWWIDGVRARERTASTYVQTARRALTTAPDTSRALVSQAEAMLAVVREAGGQHNVELSDLIFRRSVGHATAAYRLAQRPAPRAPEFGNTPHVGSCSFCHYGASDGWNYRALQPGLHERLIPSRP